MLSKIYYRISTLYLPTFFKVILIGLIESIYNFIFKRFIKHDKHKKVHHKLAVITGGAKGLGKALTERLISLGYNVHIISRDYKALKKIKSKHKNKITFTVLDLSDLEEIKLKVEELSNKHIDLLINNAGVLYRHKVYKHNEEINFLVNHLGHFVLTMALKNVRRVVNVSSNVAYAINDLTEVWFDVLMDNYARSKLANLLFTQYLKQRGQDAVAVHPGMIYTGICNNTIFRFALMWIKYVFPYILNTVEEGVDNVLSAAFAELGDEPVDFFMNGKRAIVPKGVNLENMEKMKMISEKIGSKHIGWTPSSWKNE